MTLVTVNQDGSITLPQWAIERLWAEEGSPLRVHIQDNWVVLRLDGIA